MITIEINTAEKLLTSITNKVKTNRLFHCAFVSNDLNIERLFEISGLNDAHLVTTHNRDDDRATIALAFQSFLFVGFKDKSFYREQGFPIDIEHIRQQVLILKKDYDIKTIVIDNFDKVTATAMGRRILFTKDRGAMFHWRTRRSEYNMALLYYISNKYDVNFIIGKELNNNISSPLKISAIKYLDFGCNYDMVDDIIDTQHNTNYKLK